MHLTANGKKLPYLSPTLNMRLIMKFTTFMLLATCLQLYATGVAQINLVEKHASLEKVLQTIKKQSGYDLVYDISMLSQKAKPVDVDLKNSSVPQALDNIFKSQELTYEIINKIICVKEKPVLRSFTADLGLFFLPPAENPIRGKVTDEKGASLQNVNVKIKNSNIGTQTDIDGRFSIAARKGETLVFSFIGYKNKEIVVGTNTIINLSLIPVTDSLSDVVVLAFGTQKKINMTGAVNTISANDVVSSPVANITNALVGNSPGITGMQQGGEPGRNATNIYIRGVSTFSGSTNPLIVIDGVEQPAEQPYAQLNAMDANEIESISVLKDASSTAVYGIRAANGVIIVTTKRGKTGKPVLSLSTNFGANAAANLLHTANSYEYALMRNEAVNIYNNEQANTSWNTLLFNAEDLWKFQNNRDYTPAEVAAMTNLTPQQQAQLNNSPALYYTSTDWWHNEFSGVGLQQQYNINVRGGTDKVKYYTSVGYFSQGDILQNVKYGNNNKGSFYNRGNFRSNFDITPSKNLTISLNIAGQFNTYGGPGAYLTGTANGGQTSPTDWSSRYKAIEEDIYESNPFMEPAVIQGHVISGYAGQAGSSLNPLGIKGSTQVNPLTNVLTSGEGIVYNTMLSGSAKIKYTMDFITKGLSVHGTANYDDNYTKYVSSYPTIPTYTFYRDPVNPNNVDFFGGATSYTTFNTANTYGYNTTWHKLYLDAGIDYARSFGDHNITALVLGKASQYYIPVDAYNTPSGIMGLVGRVTYNYKQRYMLEYNVGYNGTEEFAVGHRFGFFPAYSAGWIPTSEKFFPKNDWVTFLKVRASYGQTGNDQINGRRYLYLPNTYNLNNQTGYYLGNGNGSANNPYVAGSNEGANGNSNVTWEKAQTYDGGIDMRFFKDKLALTADVFRQDRNNILTTLATISAVYGVSGGNIPPVNVGQTTNHGYEVSATWTDHYKKVGYSITGQVSYNHNKIIYQAEVPNPYSWMNRTGKPIGQYFGLRSDGFFNTAADLANRPFDTYSSGQNVLGDIRYKDLSGTGIINAQDMAPMGYTNIPEYSYSFRIRLDYKGFDFTALINGTANGSFYLNQGLTDVFFKGFGMVYQWQYDGYWTPEKVANHQAISYPRPEINTSSANSNFVTSDFWLKSNNFIKLKNAQIGYTFPKTRALQRAYINGIRLFINGDNLYIFKAPLKKYGIDPETTDVNSQFIFPITRAFNCGFNIQF
jgi:TonB-linked SusC/RagA family outer membrane protein